MKILIACEFSGTVRDAFIKEGHNAVSCDLKNSVTEGPHIKNDVIELLHEGWDMLIAFPPCTYLASSSSSWFQYRLSEQAEALSFVNQLMGAPIRRICIENPVGVISTYIKKPTQIVQPWMFGHGETKATCLWLKNLPRLRYTDIVKGRKNRIHKMGQSINRRSKRSITFPGIAKAMAEQWGILK